MTEVAEPSGPQETSSTASDVVNWLDDEQLSNVASFAYWNDEDVERDKEAFYIVDGDTARLTRYLGDETGYLDELETAIRFATEAGCPPRGRSTDSTQ
jgi:hypothetical protein